MKRVKSKRQVTRLFVMQRDGLAKADPNDWQECHLEQCRDSPQQQRPSSLEVGRREKAAANTFVRSVLSGHRDFDLSAVKWLGIKVT